MAEPRQTPEPVVGVAVAGRRLVLLILATAAGGAVALVLVSPGAVQGSWLFRAFVSALLVAGIGGLSWRIWRCPQCRGHLGTRAFVKQCPECGVRLRSRGGGAA